MPGIYYITVTYTHACPLGLPITTVTLVVQQEWSPPLQKLFVLIC